MAREVSLNPRKLGKIANHRQEPWKAPLPQFIEDLYLKRVGRRRPQVVTAAERWARPAPDQPVLAGVPAGRRLSWYS